MIQSEYVGHDLCSVLAQKRRRMAVSHWCFGHLYWAGQQTCCCPAIGRMPHVMNHFARDDLRVIEHLLEVIYGTASYVMGFELLQPKCRRARGDNGIEDPGQLLSILDSHLVGLKA